MPLRVNMPVARGMRKSLIYACMPLALLLACALLTNVGAGARPATAASASVTVNATVASVVTLTPCGASISFTITMGTGGGSACNVTFGASNNAALPLTIADNAGAGQFLSGAFTETGAGCGAMTGDSIGYKILDTVTATVNTACPASSIAVNSNYMPFPNTATTACTTNALGNQMCPIMVAAVETGSNATAGTYTGQFNLAA